MNTIPLFLRTVRFRVEKEYHPEKPAALSQKRCRHTPCAVLATPPIQSNPTQPNSAPTQPNSAPTLFNTTPHGVCLFLQTIPCGKRSPSPIFTFKDFSPTFKTVNNYNFDCYLFTLIWFVKGRPNSLGQSKPTEAKSCPTLPIPNQGDARLLECRQGIAFQP